MTANRGGGGDMAARGMESVAPPIVAGLAALADRYQAFIVDLWGTLHDGLAPYPGAVACLGALKATGKPVALLSNVPARAQAVAVRLAELGIAPDSYDFLHSSGEEVWRHLHDAFDSPYAELGTRFLFVGPDRHRDLLDDLAFIETDNLEQADFIVCTGLREGSKTIDDEDGLLAAAAGLDLQLICANPDLKVMQGTDLLLCAGSLAAAYERDFGGKVRWHGKPHRPAFTACLDLLGVGEPADAAMIGDTMHTDIAGGVGVGMGTALIAGGIHVQQLTQPDDLLSPEKIEKFFTGRPIQPDAIMARFVW